MIRRSRTMRRLIGSLLALAAAQAAAAHDSDFSLLHLRIEGARVVGTWEIHWRDARVAVGLPADPDTPAAVAELRPRSAAVRRLLEDGLALTSQQGDCPLQVADAFDVPADGRPVIRLALEARCPGEIAALTLDYRVLIALDPAHRGYFNVEDARRTHVGVFADGQTRVTLAVDRLDRWRSFRDYTREGVWHIWTGWDHALFLLALLLPAPLVREQGAWRPRRRLGPTLREVAGVVTAFTLAHSTTLVLAVIGPAALPSRPIETAIAGSVAVAAWNNLRPFLPGRTWLLAGGFGLLHGLGFAGALAALGLPRQARGVALLGFNVGVELGQLAIVAVVLPLAFAVRKRVAYERLALGAGSLGIAWLALVWMLERALGVALLPGS